jgi:hypothetical protein
VPGATALVAVWFQEGGVPVLLSLEVPLSPLFYEDDQIFIFPAPISCLGEPLFAGYQRGFSAKEAAEKVCTGLESKTSGAEARRILNHVRPD